MKLKRSVLIVDDDESIRMLYNYILDERGINCTMSPNGTDALEKIKNLEFDFMILDIMMPDITGWQVIVKAKNKGLKIPPYIVMTGENFISNFKEFNFEKEKEFRGYYPKMTDPEKIADVVTKNISEQIK